MFSRIRYINYPATIRKKMVKRDKTKVKTKKPISVVKVLIIALLVSAIPPVSALTVFWIKGRSEARHEATINIDTNIILEDNGSSPVIKDSGKTIKYCGVTYTFNSDIVSFAFIGIDKENMGLDDGIVGTGGQSDTIAILAYDTSTGETKVIVVPRETMVDVNTFDVKGGYLDIKKMQICNAYAYGDGAKTSCENSLSSISRLLFGLQIDHYIALDLDGIIAINDAVGGVEVTCLETIGQFTEGETITLQGEMADHYVRDRRHDIVDADSARRARQKQYVENFVAKSTSMVKKDFTLVPRLWSFASDYMVTDLTINDATYLATVALRKNISLGKFTTVPGSYAMGEVYAEYTADQEGLFELVLDTFYTK